MPRHRKPWWACVKCGSWDWADKCACSSCGAKPDAATASWLAKCGCRSGYSQSTAGNAAKEGALARGADGQQPRTITVGDFTLVVGKGKKAQRKARQDMQRLLDLDKSAAKQGIVAPGHKASDADPDTANTDAGPAGPDGPAAAAAGGPEAMEAELTALQALSDDELELAIKALSKAGLPGRDAYLAEQQRRRDARQASKPAWVKVRAVEAKWKKAQAKTAKAEAALQEAHAAVEASRKAWANAESAAVAASNHLAAARAEEASAKAEVEKPSAAADASAPKGSEPTVPAVQALPADYKQQPAVAAKLQQAEQLLQEVLDGAPPAAPAKPAANAGCSSGGGAAGRAAGASAGLRTASLPARRDELWEAARHRSRSPARDLRYAGRRNQCS